MSIELALIPIAIAVAGAVMSRQQQAVTNEPQPAYLLPTICRNPALLQQALQAYGCRTVESAQQLDAALAGGRVLFAPDAQGAWSATFPGAIPAADARAFLEEIETLYRQQVQQQVYQRVLERARQSGLALEQETIEEDHSVVLTFQIQE